MVEHYCFEVMVVFGPCMLHMPCIWGTPGVYKPCNYYMIASSSDNTKYQRSGDPLKAMSLQAMKRIRRRSSKNVSKRIAITQ